MALDLCGSALYETVFQVAFQIVAVFFQHGGIVRGSGIALLQLLQFQVRLLGDLRQRRGSVVYHFAVVVHAGLLKQVIIACGVIRQHREDELAFLRGTVNQQRFLQWNDRILAFVIRHKDTFVYFFVDVQLFKCLFPQAPACKAVGSVEQQHTQRPPQRHKKHHRSKISLHLQYLGPGQQPDPPAYGQMYCQQHKTKPEPVTHAMPPVLQR